MGRRIPGFLLLSLISIAATSCVLQKLPPFAACGGQLAGTWRVVHSQLDIHTKTRGSCSAELDLTRVQFRGIYRFNDDTTYRIALEASGDWITRIPAQCGRNPTSCDEMEKRLRRLFLAPNAPDHPVRCSGRARCTCSHALDALTVKDEGTYVVDGTDVRFGPQNRLAYCVSSDRLELLAVEGTGALGGDDDYTGRLVLIREPEAVER